jgi:hypothetical protein
MCGIGAAFAIHRLPASYAVAGFHRGWPAADWSAWYGSLGFTPSFLLAFVLLPLLYPDGRLPSPRWRPLLWTAALMLVSATVLAFTEPTLDPGGLGTIVDNRFHTEALNFLAPVVGVTVAIGFAVGFRLGGSVQAALAAFGLLIIIGFAFIWFFIALGLVAGSPQAAQGMGLVVFPLTFVSSAYVPVETMPGWMQPFAEHQPLTVMINAVRALTQGPAAEALLGAPANVYIGRSLLWALGIVAVFGALAIAQYQRR